MALKCPQYERRSADHWVLVLSVISAVVTVSQDAGVMSRLDVAGHVFDGVNLCRREAGSVGSRRSCGRTPVRPACSYITIPSNKQSVYTKCAKYCNSSVARICCEEGQRLKLCHGSLTVDFGAGCSSCSMTNSFVTNAVLIERAVSCWHLHQLISQTTQYLDSGLSALEVEGGTCPSAP